MIQWLIKNIHRHLEIVNHKAMIHFLIWFQGLMINQKFQRQRSRSSKVKNPKFKGQDQSIEKQEQ